MTDDESLNLAVAQRVLLAEIPPKARFAIAKKSAEGAYAEGCKLLTQEHMDQIHKECELIGIENRVMERKATRSHLPYYRKPVSMHYLFEAIYGEGCWQDESFVEDTLKHHPELRINVKYGIHGQQYVNGKGR